MSTWVTDLNFSYSGRALAPALRRLLSHLIDARAAAHAELAQYTRTSDDAIAVWANTVDLRATDADKRRYERAMAYVRAVEAVRETELWLFEAMRQPTATWAIDLATVARMYPVQVAPETTAVALLCTPAPSPRRGPVVAWFASAWQRLAQAFRLA